MDTPSSPELPDWLAQPASLEPPRDRDGFLRSNLLRLAALPARLATAPGRLAPTDRLLARVPALLRLVGLIAVAACVSAATNMAFVWLVLAGVLVTLALRPTEQLRAITLPALLAAGLTALVAVPGVALALAPLSALLRIGAKTFCMVALTLGLAQGVPWPRMATALTAAHAPTTLVFVIDQTLRGIVVLGRVATRLTEALSLRSVGRNHDKSGSSGAIMGMVFVRSSLFAHAQAEAMTCRGFDGRPTTAPERPSISAGICYGVAVALLVVVFFWLERAMRLGV